MYAMEALPDTAGVLGDSATAGSSNTVCVFDPNGDMLTMQSTALKEFADYGDIARVDLSLVVVLKCALLTYFDVRSAQLVLLRMAGRVESFPPLAHDCRIVRVKVGALFERVPVLAATGGFGQFGEVAHVAVSGGDALVEYFDTRAASRLMAAAGDTASPMMLAGQSQQTNLLASAALVVGSMGSQAGLEHLGGLLGWSGMEAGLAGSSPSLPPGLEGGQQVSYLPARAPPAAEEAAAAAATGGTPGSAGRTDYAATEKVAKHPVRSKINSKDLSKFDIDPDKIQRGEDPRTTVMVRNLSGPNSRKGFLTFLARCGLQERYTFFYMPCKSHRSIPSGLAFVNFAAAQDVHRLFVMLKAGFWRECMTDPVSKSPAVSYATFQGHEELVKHFNSSAVSHEPDPEKRPIFRYEVLKAVEEQACSKDEGGTGAAGSPTFAAKGAAAPPPPAALPVGLVGDKSLGGATAAGGAAAAGGPGLGVGDDLQAALSKGAQEIAAILMRQKAGLRQATGAAVLGGAEPAPMKVLTSGAKKAVYSSASESDDSGKSLGLPEEGVGA